MSTVSPRTPAELQDQPLLANGELTVQSSNAQEANASQDASWVRTSLTSSLAALRRAFSKGHQAQQLASNDPDLESNGAGASAAESQAAAGQVGVAGQAAAAPADASSSSTSSATDAAGPLSAASRSGSGEIASTEPKPGSPKLGRLGSRSQDKVCLICLETLTPEDFESGRAISLECNCRGDLALRHKDCAVKWAQVKGDLVCELCKAPVRNLPALPPRPQNEAEEQFLPGDHAALMELTPSYADLVFDCIRVCWVAMIVSILFFEMNLGAALWTGLVAGLAYSFMVRLMYRQHYAAMQRMAEQQQAAAQQTAAHAVQALRAEAGQALPAGAVDAAHQAQQPGQPGRPLQVIVVSASEARLM
ncbi:hypothetical protein N2152v2_006233 [Parachlorella kessleri]